MALKHREDPISSYIKICGNEPTVGLCQIQLHIKQSVPMDIANRKGIKQNYNNLINAVPDIENSIHEIRKIKQLNDVFIPLMQSHIEESIKALDQLKK